MNDLPGMDTDVISRPSKSTIKDLSFYIGFTRIGSSIKHLGPCFGTKGNFRRDLGPCFGMNGHFRRDPDVISRPPESTIDFLSFYIGFKSLSRLKMVVLDKHIGFERCFIEYFNFCFNVLFCSGDHSRTC